MKYMMETDWLSGSPISELASLGETVSFPQGSLILREGDPGNELFVLIEGEICTWTENADGHRFVIGISTPGTLFGEGALDGGPRTASIEAVTAVTCAVVGYDLMRERMRHDPSFSMALVMLLIERNRSTSHRLKSLALDTVYKRLRAALGADPREIRITQQDLADSIGSSRDMVTRIFRDLAKGGYIATGRGTVHILKSLPQTW